MHRTHGSTDIDATADRITDAVIGLGALSVLMMTVVTVFAG